MSRRALQDREVRIAKQKERELYREMAKMQEGPLTDDDADVMIGTVDSDSEEDE